VGGMIASSRPVVPRSTHGIQSKHVCQRIVSSRGQAPRLPRWTLPDRPPDRPGLRHRMPCGWCCGVRLMASRIRAHSTICPNQPATSNHLDRLRGAGG